MSTEDRKSEMHIETCQLKTEGGTELWVAVPSVQERSTKRLPVEIGTVLL